MPLAPGADGTTEQNEAERPDNSDLACNNPGAIQANRLGTSLVFSVYADALNISRAAVGERLLPLLSHSFIMAAGARGERPKQPPCAPRRSIHEKGTASLFPDRGGRGPRRRGSRG